MQFVALYPFTDSKNDLLYNEATAQNGDQLRPLRVLDSPAMLHSAYDEDVAAANAAEVLGA